MADWTNKEWWDAFDCSGMWLTKRLRGSSGDRPAGVQPYMFMRHGIDIASGVYHGSSCPMEEVLYWMHKVMALGSIPIIWPGARAGWTEADSLRVGRDYAEFLPWVHETKSLKYAVCIDSYTTLQTGRTSQREQIDDRALSPRAGMARALLEEHVPFDVIRLPLRRESPKTRRTSESSLETDSIRCDNPESPPILRQEHFVQ